MNQLAVAESGVDELVRSSLDIYPMLKTQVLSTPLVRLPWLDTPKRRVWAKMESQQYSGSFKWRGAVAAAIRTPPEFRLVTGSAGNHGLALAMVAQQLGRQCRVHVPYSATDVKIRRIQRTGADLVPGGRDLYQCIKIARDSCGTTDVFVSPFQDWNVVYGQATIALNLQEQRPEGFRHLVIPLGGGGLFAGMATMTRSIWPDTLCHAVVPAALGRGSLEDDLALELAKPTLPTVADGLAVQHEPHSWLPALVRAGASSFRHVSEKHINAAMLAVLNQESLLIEGAGAIGVAALLYDPTFDELEGDTCVLITGGNVSASRLTNAITTDYGDLANREALGLKRIELVSEATRRHGPLQRLDAPSVQHPELHPYDNDEAYLGTWQHLSQGLLQACVEGQDLIASHQQFLAALALPAFGPAIGSATAALSEAALLLEASIADADIQQIQGRYRLAIQKYALGVRVLDWCSATSDQAGHVAFFDPATAQSSSVNYDRYGTSALQAAEQRMLGMLGFDSSSQTLLLTSSGQAAFTVVESYLLRLANASFRRVATSPYIYFEVMEQLESSLGLAVSTAPDWSVAALIATVERNDCGTIFVDPVANKQTLDIFDFQELAAALEGRDWSSKILVVDGTMTSGGFDPFKIFDKGNHPRVIYFESCSKYTQLGLDLQMAGAIVVQSHLVENLVRLRRNTGTVMYSSQVRLLPRCDRHGYLARMRRLSANAENIATHFNLIASDSFTVRARFPFDWRERGWSHGGAIVTLEFNPPGLNHRQFLDALIERMLDRCREEKLRLGKGVSFGFAVTRVSAAAAMADQTDPFLRISAGDESAEEAVKLARCLVEATIELFNALQVTN